MSFTIDNLRKAGDVAARKMMGEYCVYYQAAQRPVDDDPVPAGMEGRKLIGNICDNCLFLKPTESVLRLMPDADRVYPYEGSKTLMAVAEDAEDTELMAEVLDGMYRELPGAKKKRISIPVRNLKNCQTHIQFLSWKKIFMVRAKQFIRSLSKSVFKFREIFLCLFFGQYSICSYEVKSIHT